MKTLGRTLGLAVLLSGAGCVTLPSSWQKTPPPAPHVAAKPAARPAAMVTADQVSEANAHEKAQALLRELDQEEAAPATPPTPSRPAKK